MFDLKSFRKTLQPSTKFLKKYLTEKFPKNLE
jgi:hypothetical protein